MALVNVTHEGDTAVVAFSRPPLNAFNLELIEELHVCLQRLAVEPPPGEAAPYEPVDYVDCQECKARITRATMENNSLGYSGSNSGGSLAIERSLFRHNSSGVLPNSENPGDAPPPQDGECNRENIEKPNPTPTITTTRIPRCTVIRNTT
jgi:hypothetical protein